MPKNEALVGLKNQFDPHIGYADYRLCTNNTPINSAMCLILYYNLNNKVFVLNFSHAPLNKTHYTLYALHAKVLMAWRFFYAERRCSISQLSIITHSHKQAMGIVSIFAA